MRTDDPVPVPDTVTELEFAVTDPSVPCVAATTELGGVFELEEVIPREEGYAEYYSVTDLEPDALLEHAASREASEAQFLSRAEDAGLLELTVTEACPVMRLAEGGALPRSVDAAGGVCRIVAEVPPPYDDTEVTAGFLDSYPDADLVAKRDRSYFTPLFSHRQFDRAIEEGLTDRQQEVLEMATRRGYYEWPREVTQEELAEDLDIATPTFTQHLRAAEEKLMQMAFERGDPPADSDDEPNEA
ncbi:helix-turn-helix domain-containing protein [Halomicrobium urmianum]|uniref:helix-turn-helix domain-containing protein n=1 Tax=Halomicrobium urmianum TaxID=1586233 RepID=UPI001CD9C67B|nr:bacterio-opsin activator domain-containing protein [Halomicrobium urmianum]